MKLRGTLHHYREDVMLDYYATERPLTCRFAPGTKDLKGPLRCPWG